MPKLITKRFYLALIIILSLLWMYGCNPANRVQKNQAAYQALINDYLSKNPPRIDTNTELIVGGMDTVFYPVIVIDSNTIVQVKDSLQTVLKSSGKDCEREINEAFETGKRQALYQLQKMKFAKPRPDTIIQRIYHTDYENSLKDEIKALDLMITQKDKTIDKKQKLIWFLAAYSLLNALIIFFIARVKIPAKK